MFVNLSLPTKITFRNYNMKHQLSPISSTFYNSEDTIVHWYRDLLLDSRHSTGSTGEENYLFVAYGLTPLNNSASTNSIYCTTTLSLLLGFSHRMALQGYEHPRANRQSKRVTKPTESRGKLNPPGRLSL
jgi:hypothetical protein